MTEKEKIKDINLLLEKIETDLSSWLESHERKRTFLVGIRTGGVWLADYLHKKLGFTNELGELDISFYRDDFEQKGLHPQVKPSNLDFNVDNAQIILVDDVIMTGRTIRAALNEIFDYGRPESVTLVSLIELDSKQLPIRSDIFGQRLSLLPSQRVELRGPEPMSLEILEVPEGPDKGSQAAE